MKKNNLRPPQKLITTFFICITILFFGIATLLFFDNKSATKKPILETNAVKASDLSESSEAAERIDESYQDYVNSQHKSSFVSKYPDKSSDKSVTSKNTEASKIDFPSSDTNCISSDVKKRVEKQLNAMSLSEKVCQLFFITPEQLTGIGCVVQAGEPFKLALSEYPVGGLIYFSSNLKTTEQIKGMLANIRSFSKIAPFAGIDEEGGTISRITESNIAVPHFDNMYSIGQSNDFSKAFDVGNNIGIYLSDLGFNVDFAPVCDIVENTEDSAIGERSFGNNPVKVSQMTNRIVNGLQKHNVEPCLKHFPGLGSSTSDTHKGLAVFHQTLDDLKENDIIPFKENIKQGVNFIMVGHGSYPNITNDDKPASMSSFFITDLLRKELNYHGIIITDALNMNAITDNYRDDEIAINVLNAGADMLLMPNDFQTTYKSILNAIQTGHLTEDRIDESVKRILEIKYSIK